MCFLCSFSFNGDNAEMVSFGLNLFLRSKLENNIFEKLDKKNSLEKNIKFGKRLHKNQTHYDSYLLITHSHFIFQK